MYSDWERVEADGTTWLQRFPTDAPQRMEFRVIRDEWEPDPPPSDHNPEGIPERTILQLDVLQTSV